MAQEFITSHLMQKYNASAAETDNKAWAIAALEQATAQSNSNSNSSPQQETKEATEIIGTISHQQQQQQQQQLPPFDRSAGQMQVHTTHEI